MQKKKESEDVLVEVEKEREGVRRAGERRAKERKYLGDENRWISDSLGSRIRGSKRRASPNGRSKD